MAESLVRGRLGNLSRRLRLTPSITSHIVDNLSHRLREQKWGLYSIFENSILTPAAQRPISHVNRHKILRNPCSHTRTPLLNRVFDSVFARIAVSDAPRLFSSGPLHSWRTPQNKSFYPLKISRGPAPGPRRLCRLRGLRSDDRASCSRRTFYKFRDWISSAIECKVARILNCTSLVEAKHERQSTMKC